MKSYKPYAYLKTIDGDEVCEYSKDMFEKLINELRIREVKKSDRTIFFIHDNGKSNGVKFFKDDYFEIISR